MNLTHEQQLSLISKAWGKQHGYCFFPTISGKAKDKAERIKSYDEGPAFQWPRDKAKILRRMADHELDDLYWCPNLFEHPRRIMENAMDECALWADLDEKDPRTIKDYPPTIAWETSPGRYQALWLMAGAHDIQGASWRGGENHRLTHHLDADPSGWDTTQLLRIPGWQNHKPEYAGPTPILGKLLWKDGRQYMPDDFGDLPVLEQVDQFEDILEDQIATVDVQAVWGRVRLKVTKAVRELVKAREVDGDRSAKLWQIERDLADAGCTAVEVVAVVRTTVWNKFAGRQDELKRLTIEASKAISSRSDLTERRIEADREDKPRPQRLWMLIKNIPDPSWLIKDLWTNGSCGFIAGQPKAFKSWMALDLVLSVSTGTDFLGTFPVLNPGPVLYVQEEDGLPTLKSRYDKVWPAKKADKMIMAEDGHSVIWVPATEMEEPEVDAFVRGGFVLSDEGWQTWLDDVLTDGFGHEAEDEDENRGATPYRLVVLDPLMMIMGEVEENKASAMTEKIFKPLKQMAEKHGCAVVVVHHMRKSQEGIGAKNASGQGYFRGGSLMLGSNAAHAWVEDALYVKLTRTGVEIERESKSASYAQFTVKGLHGSRTWDPHAGPLEGLFSDQESSPGTSPTKPRQQGPRGVGRGPKIENNKILQVLKDHGKLSAGRIGLEAGITKSGVHAQLRRLQARGLIRKVGPSWILA